MAAVKFIPQMLKRKTELRVAAYARVSAGKDEAINSLSAQVDYYSKLINANPVWTLAGIYIDEARSGTKDTRENFTRMLEDCRAGKIDFIITKSVSRFARNTILLLTTCRELKELGIDVYFESQRIHSISDEGELILTMIASLAQEEARSDSENMKWRVKMNFEQGKPWSGKIYGYRLVDGVFQIVPEEAEVVRRIFQYYLDGYGFYKISQLLTEENVATRHHNVWRENTIRGMLINRTYTGDLILQKTYRENYITKKKMKNHGERDLFIVEEAHEPIIDKATFDAAQKELERRAQKFGGKTEKQLDDVFSKRIVCENCGGVYRRRTNRGKVTWICITYNRYGKAVCPVSQQIPDSELKRIAAEVLEIPAFDEKVFDVQIDHITACDGHRLLFHCRNGSVKERTWKVRSRAESWTPAMKEQARLARQRRSDIYA